MIIQDMQISRSFQKILALMNGCIRQIKTGLKEKMGNILEVGSGLGTISEKIIRDMGPSSHITLTDISVRYVQITQYKILLVQERFCFQNGFEYVGRVF